MSILLQTDKHYNRYGKRCIAFRPYVFILWQESRIIKSFFYRKCHICGNVHIEDAFNDTIFYCVWQQQTYIIKSFSSNVILIMQQIHRQLQFLYDRLPRTLTIKTDKILVLCSV